MLGNLPGPRVTHGQRVEARHEGPRAADGSESAKAGHLAGAELDAQVVAERPSRRDDELVVHVREVVAEDVELVALRDDERRKSNAATSALQ